jgi:hypothetical protein
MYQQLVIKFIGNLLPPAYEKHREHANNSAQKKINKLLLSESIFAVKWSIKRKLLWDNDYKETDIVSECVLTCMRTIEEQVFSLIKANGHAIKSKWSELLLSKSITCKQ